MIPVFLPCKRHEWAPPYMKELRWKEDKNTGTEYDRTWYYTYFCLKCHNIKKVKGEKDE